MEITFYKFHGAGNDFILIDNRNKMFPARQEVVSWLCARHTGIGADGLILLENTGNADFSMRYFNADGGESTLCGNGGRCITAFAAQLGIIRESTVFSAIDGLHESKILSAEKNLSIASLRMNHVDKVSELEEGFYLNTGSPHLVRFSKDVDAIDLITEGKKIRNLEKFAPHGVNVNFVQFIPDGIYVRTYERGVEAETLSCGTGAVASAIAASLKSGGIKSPVSVKARGGNLQVVFDRDETGFGNIWLEGPAVCVFSGTVNL
ncbi:MAG: diaminopimelate epimerase [Bacteroidales bacterium]